MKYLLASIVLLLFSCDNSEEKIDIKSIENHIDNSELVDMVNKVEGTWIDINYVKALRKTKSPYQAQKLYPYFLVYIDKDEINGNIIGIYDHEYDQTESAYLKHYNLDGDSFVFVYETAVGEIFGDTCKHNCPIISFKVEGDITIMQISRKNKKTRELIRIDSDCIDNNFNCEITKLTASIVLQGEYELLDNQRNIISDNLIINEFGLIKGHDKFRRAVLWDYFREGNHIYKFDVLQFLISDKEMKRYGYLDESDENIFKYESKGDTITLTETISDQKNWELELGNIAYYLVKKQN